MEERSNVSNSEYFEVATHITDLYSGDDEKFENEHMPRFEEITKRYRKFYGFKPSFFSRAPGKINLMGDYLLQNGYSMMSAALEQDNIIAFSTTDDPFIEINHILPSIYPPEKLSNDPTQKFKEENHYINYFLAGYKAALTDLNLEKLPGIKLLITGNLPFGAGLGSSTSLIVSAALMTLFVNNLLTKIKKNKLIESIVKYEKMLSETNSEKIDPVLISTSVKGAALCMSSTEQPMKFKLPTEFALVIAHSLTPTAKLLTLGTHNNKRIVECRLAVCLLAKELQISEKVQLKTLRELQDLLSYSLEDMINLVELHLKKDPYKTKELEDLLESSLIKPLSDIPYADLVLNSNHEFFLYK